MFDIMNKDNSLKPKAKKTNIINIMNSMKFDDSLQQLGYIYKKITLEKTNMIKTTTMY